VVFHESARQLYRQRGTALAELTKCRHCLNDMPMFGNYHHRRGPSQFCSRECKYAWYRINGWPRSKRTAADKICAGCGSRTTRSNAIYCSRGCRDLARMLPESQKLQNRAAYRKSYYQANRESLIGKTRYWYQSNRDGVRRERARNTPEIGKTSSLRINVGGSRHAAKLSPEPTSENTPNGVRGHVGVAVRKCPNAAVRHDKAALGVREAAPARDEGVGHACRGGEQSVTYRLLCHPPPSVRHHRTAVADL
jgi:hypothetical protein